MKLQVADLNSFYGPAHILFDIALEVGEGEVVALLAQRRRKSTTFRSIKVSSKPLGRIIFEAGMFPASRPMRSCAAGSATCRKSGASSPI